MKTNDFKPEEILEMAKYRFTIRVKIKEGEKIGDEDVTVYCLTALEISDNWYVIAFWCNFSKGEMLSSGASVLEESAFIQNYSMKKEEYQILKELAWGKKLLQKQVIIQADNKDPEFIPLTNISVVMYLSQALGILQSERILKSDIKNHIREGLYLSLMEIIVIWNKAFSN